MFLDIQPTCCTAKTMNDGMPTNSITPIVKAAGIKKCPECDDTLERIDRTFLMRIFAGSKRYQCPVCKRTYFFYFERLFRMW